MNWPNFTLKEKLQLLLAVFLCILFSIRYYPGNLEKTLLDSARWIFSFFFYSGVFTYMLRGLSRKVFKRTFSLKTAIKMTVWLALLSSITQSLHEAFKIQQGP
ncbi:MAG: hypothetical protein GXO20_01425 [Thermodesulfobacteria bacterium]|nr:hypothetical protein [Thermodesulfobacteriota bacterium]